MKFSHKGFTLVELLIASREIAASARSAEVLNNMLIWKKAAIACYMDYLDYWTGQGKGKDIQKLSRGQAGNGTVQREAAQYVLNGKPDSGKKDTGKVSQCTIVNNTTQDCMRFIKCYVPDNRFLQKLVKYAKSADILKGHKIKNRKFVVLTDAALQKDVWDGEEYVYMYVIGGEQYFDSKITLS